MKDKTFSFASKKSTLSDDAIVLIDDEREFLSASLPHLEDQALDKTRTNNKARGVAVKKVNKGGAKKDTEIFLDASHSNVCWKTTGFFQSMVKGINAVQVTDVLRTEEGEQGGEYQLTLVTQSREFRFSTASKVLRDLWARTLKVLQKMKDLDAASDPFMYYIQSMWNSVDVDRSGVLDLAEVGKVMQNMNITCSKSELKKIFDSVDKDKSNTLDDKEFLGCMKELFNRRPEVHTIVKSFQQKTGAPFDDNAPAISVEQVRKFFAQEQGEELPLAAVQQLVLGSACAQGTGDGTAAEQLQLFQVALLLDSAENSIWNPALRARCAQPGYMDQPLSSYWINSSHNTYLTGDQLAGVSSAEQYSYVLQRGCRCVEIDCWDGAPGVPEGNPGDEPIVTHGHTVCSKIPFRHVIAAIKKSAFATNPYPIILSIEMHCSDPFQVKMFQICTELLGDMIYIPEPNAARLPSPNALRGRVLIKGTKAKAPQQVEEPESASSDDEVGAAEMLAKAKPAAAAAAAAAPPKAVKKGKTAINAQWSTLVALSARPFKRLDQPGQPWDMSSFAEGKTRKMCAASADAFAVYNRRQLSRIYPFGGRIDSSNLDPLAAWAAGCQLVALNYQTGDVPMQLNLGKFTYNGGCGYVLKPDHLLGTAPRPAGPVRFKITVLSGQRLPGGGGRDILDPYVVVEVHSPAPSGGGGAVARQRTKTVENNGFNPVWEEPPMDFAVPDPSTALLRIVVMDDDVGQDRTVGQCSMPVAAMRPGVRHVALNDVHGVPVPHAGLLVRVEADATSLNPPRAPFPPAP